MCVTLYGTGNHTIATLIVAPRITMRVDCEGQAYLLDHRQREGFDPVGLRRYTPIVGMRLVDPDEPRTTVMSVDCSDTNHATVCSDAAAAWLLTIGTSMAYVLANLVLAQQRAAAVGN